MGLALHDNASLRCFKIEKLSGLFFLTPPQDSDDAICNFIDLRDIVYLNVAMIVMIKCPHENKIQR